MQDWPFSFNRRRLFALLPLGLVSAGCSWFSDELTVRVGLPTPPEHWIGAFAQLRYELVIPRADGSSERVPWPADGRLSIPKEPNWPVLAVPLALEGRVELPPAGGVWPLDLSADGQELVLSWGSGPLAATLVALRREGVDLSSLNTARLAREMRERSGSDPWSLDLVYFEERLASGEFRVTDIRALPSRDLLLEIPAGQWFLESPSRLPQLVAEGEPLALPEVPFGAHRLFRIDGLAAYAVYVGEQDVLFFAVSGHQSRNEVLGENDEYQ
jgi:hypothetical protein